MCKNRIIMEYFGIVTILQLNYVRKIILCTYEIPNYVKITKSDPNLTTHNRIIPTNRSQA
jgi:hypothetical protein